MPTQSSADPHRRRWLTGPSTFPWQSDERAYAALLDALVRDRLETEAVAREMQAAAEQSPADLQQAQVQAERDELEEVRQELETFRSALEDARARAGPGRGAEVPYDAADPTRDAQADVLIQYLVRPGFATVRTEEPEPGHYVYHIAIAWDRLRALAAELGQPLPV